MKLATYEAAGHRSFGILTPGGVIDLARRLGVADMEAMLAQGLLGHAGSFANDAPDHTRFRLLKPLHHPGKCFCVGVNYPDRNAEYKDGSTLPKYASLFQRVPESFSGPDEAILRPPESTQFDYEGEIVLVIGTPGRRIPAADAMHHVAGYTLANEGTLRDWIRHGKFNVTQGKNFYRSGALGPYITTRDEAGDGPFHLTTHVNGELRQEDTTDRMMFSMGKIIEYVSIFTPLAAGDIILTGTPTGAGARFDPPKWLVPGDEVVVTATGLGTLRNRVADETP
ncbi:fumarylacetoacetate hydrolase family protein [Limobrevibacterium gyesilva]|uniref:Fumarylacetoacetate hydrolase family protein n=1 Tax=Limobrevibacterium gyesilva TaxID=2991712 RepID=A0AA42CFR9_9PROT|nr:fumarylacetoacetate hydrolase family protein [Limobrevibacterium gyesilva]MCW3476959.1 fumarylacetoacetate hydrolase family protein [Limobrevibacterium gyesilva]